MTLIGPWPAIDGVAVDLHFAGKRPCTLSKRSRWALVSTGPRSLSGHDLDVGAAAFDDGAQDIAADAAKPIDCDANCHDGSFGKFWEASRGAATYNCALTASTTAFGSDAEMLVELRRPGPKHRSQCMPMNRPLSPSSLRQPILRCRPRSPRLALSACRSPRCGRRRAGRRTAPATAPRRPWRRDRPRLQQHRSAATAMATSEPVAKITTSALFVAGDDIGAAWPTGCRRRSRCAAPAGSGG